MQCNKMQQAATHYYTLQHTTRGGVVQFRINAGHTHCNNTLQHTTTGGVVQVGIKRRGAAGAHDSIMIVVLARSLPPDSSSSIYPPNGLPPQSSSPTVREPQGIRKVAESSLMQCDAVCCSNVGCCTVLHCHPCSCSCSGTARRHTRGVRDH